MIKRVEKEWKQRIYTSRIVVVHVFDRAVYEIIYTILVCALFIYLFISLFHLLLCILHTWRKKKDICTNVVFACPFFCVLLFHVVVAVVIIIVKLKQLDFGFLGWRNFFIFFVVVIVFFVVSFEMAAKLLWIEINIYENKREIITQNANYPNVM